MFAAPALWRAAPGQDEALIAVATQLILVEHDPLTTPEMGQTMADRIPGCEFHVVPVVGHLVNLEAPERFNELLLDFLLRHRDG